MTFPSDEQIQILQSDKRIVIVRAAPGSGKTRVFIEFLNRRMGTLPSTRQGIAALSFTKSAQQEITDRLGTPVGAPHFIGTLDSFLFRFVVKPFGNIAGINTKGARLIAAPLDEAMKGFEVKYGPDAGHRVPQFQIQFVGGTVAEPTLVTDYGYHRYEITQQFRPTVLTAKFHQWASHGFITHSDCHYIAAKILSDPTHGAAISKILTDRFPLILVDEFQDTGWFLSKALIELFRSPKASGLVVGDPDQAIFEFSGARPELFQEIEALPGAQIYDLTRSRRCPVFVCRAATLLSDIRKQVVPRDGAPPGRMKLICHTQTSPALDTRMLTTIETLAGQSRSIAILARTNKVVNSLVGRNGETNFIGQSKSGKLLGEAVHKFHTGDSAMAVRLVNTVLGDILLGDESVDRESLEAAGINPINWRTELSRLLHDLSPIVVGESWNLWLGRAKNKIQQAANNLGITLEARTLGSKFKIHNSGNVSRELTRVQPTEHWIYREAEFQTIHHSKGSEHDVVFIYFPKQTTAKCISTQWFIADQSSEERRVGFVGISRSREKLVLCVHRDTYFALKKIKPEFTQLFEPDEIVEGETS